MVNRFQIRVWVVEDNTRYSHGLARAINGISGLHCERQFKTAEELLAALGKSDDPDVLLLDIQLPGKDGIASLPEVLSLSPEIRTIILTVFDDSEKIFRAVCAGASGYLLKSAGSDEIGAAIREVFEGGAPMTPSVAKKVLRLFAKTRRQRAKPYDYHLTEREQAILKLMADGLIKKEISDVLDISIHTVTAHVRSIYEKLHVNTNIGAVAKAIREEIV